MNVSTKLVASAAVLGLAFGAAALAGAALDPTEAEDATTTPSTAHGDGEHGGRGGGAPGTSAHAAHGAAQPAAGGLAVSEGGYTLEAERTFFTAEQPASFNFRITDAQGRVVRDAFELEHERELHLIVVRRDTATYDHLHPRKGPDGTWASQLRLREPGVYRAYADFKIDEESHTLATDLFVPGDFEPRRLPEPITTARAGGYAAELVTENVRAGRPSTLRFAITRDGGPATNLEDYLGAKGHLVALREGDLAYLHVHPEGHSGRAPAAERPAASGGGHSHADGEGHGEENGDGRPSSNEIPFAATFPTPGRYRLFLQFKTDGEIRTVAYTQEVSR